MNLKKKKKTFPFQVLVSLRHERQAFTIFQERRPKFPFNEIILYRFEIMLFVQKFLSNDNIFSGIFRKYI